MNSEVKLIFCPFSRIIVVSSPLGLVISLALSSLPDLQYQSKFPTLELVLNPARKCLVTPIPLMPLLYP